jgi:hypothetical protein
MNAEAELIITRTVAPSVRSFSVIDVMSRRAILDALILSSADACAARNGPMYFVAASDGSISLYTAHHTELSVLLAGKAQADAIRSTLGILK